MEGVTIIIPVKDEESGLEYLVEDFEQSEIGNDYEIKFIFVIAFLYFFDVHLAPNCETN